MLVFDSSTLILMARIELLDSFLAGALQGIAIPEEVEKECCRAKKTLDALMIQQAVDASRIKTISVRDRKLVFRLQDDFSLGKGEAEAIALCLQEKAQLVATDDKNGINACKLLGIAFATAPAILISCREKNLISRSEAFAKLSFLGLYGRYRDSIVEDARQRLEEIL